MHGFVEKHVYIKVRFQKEYCLGNGTKTQIL